MCDYSLHHVATRPARIEDKLVATKFPNSITRGFAAAGEPHVAVCLLPGTEIAFDENVECEPSFGIGILPNKKIGQRLARFRQINMDNAVTHHDALEFPDGQVVLVTRLCEGQRATVLQLPAGASPANAEQAEPQARELSPSFSSPAGAPARRVNAAAIGGSGEDCVPISRSLRQRRSTHAAGVTPKCRATGTQPVALLVAKACGRCTLLVGERDQRLELVTARSEEHT